VLSAELLSVPVPVLVDCTFLRRKGIHCPTHSVSRIPGVSQ
jgi:hypothetical protein